MLKFLTVVAIVVHCSAYAYSGGYGGGGQAAIMQPNAGSKSVGAGIGGGSLGGTLPGGAGLIPTAGFIPSGGIIPAAVITRHSVDFRDVPLESPQPFTPQIIEVGAEMLPLTLLFRSASSRINVEQRHAGAEGGEERTSSEDEPFRLFHEVTKPIYQDVREVITPYRRIIQEIQPVQEEIQTIVARGDGRLGLLGGHLPGGGMLRGGVPPELIGYAEPRLEGKPGMKATLVDGFDLGGNGIRGGGAGYGPIGGVGYRAGRYGSGGVSGGKPY